MSFLVVAACSPDSTPPECGYARSPAGQSADDVEREYRAAWRQIDPLSPGRGYDELGNDQDDHAMAYAYVLSAAAEAYSRCGDRATLELARTSGTWLLSNRDTDGDGVIGWGLPDPWDAFSDGSVNPAHQEYTITTSVVIRGLLDWLEVDPNAPREELLSVVHGAAEPFTAGQRDTAEGLFVYSDSSFDESYEVFNPAAAMAAQLHRLALVDADDPRSVLLRQKSSRVMAVLWSHGMPDSFGGVYWDYGIGEGLDRPNDLVHASYIADAVRDYVARGGTGLPSSAVAESGAHLRVFHADSGWRERFDRADSRPPRLWAVGEALAYFSEMPEFRDSAESLLALLSDYRIDSGVYAYLPGSDAVFIRHSTHLLRGLGRYLLSSGA